MKSNLSDLNHRVDHHLFDDPAIFFLTITANLYICTEINKTICIHSLSDGRGKDFSRSRSHAGDG